MSKLKKNNNMCAAIQLLEKALDRIEGEYSEIPSCCIDSFIDGRMYMNLRNSLSEKDQKRLNKWQYVPCEKCFQKYKNGKKPKDNGMSDLGIMLLTIIETLKDKKNGTN